MRRLPALMLLFGVALGGGVPYGRGAGTGGGSGSTGGRAGSNATTLAAHSQPDAGRGAATAARSRRPAATGRRTGSSRSGTRPIRQSPRRARHRAKRRRNRRLATRNRPATARSPRAWLAYPEPDARRFCLTPGPRIPAAPAATEAPDMQGAPDADEPASLPIPAAPVIYPSRQHLGTATSQRRNRRKRMRPQSNRHAERMQARIGAAIEHARMLQAPMIVPSAMALAPTGQASIWRNFRRRISPSWR